MHLDRVPFVPEPIGQVAGEALVRLDGDERLGPERQQPPGREPGAGSDLERRGAGPQAAPSGQDLIDARMIVGAGAVVAAGVAAEESLMVWRGRVHLGSW